MEVGTLECQKEFVMEMFCWQHEALLDEPRAHDMMVVGEGVAVTGDCEGAVHSREVRKPDFALLLAAMATL